MFLVALRSNRHGLLLEVMLTSGCRPGEIGGLLWDCVDYLAGGLRIERSISWLKGGAWVLQEPKTAKGRRFIPLPPSTMERLKQHQQDQLRQQQLAGDQWKGNKEGFVFTTTVGTPVHRGNINRRHLRPVLKSMGLNAAEFRGTYSLRHSLATMLFADNTHLKLASERLGHSSTSFTADTYMHSSDLLQRGVTDRIGHLLGTGTPG